MFDNIFKHYNITLKRVADTMYMCMCVCMCSGVFLTSFEVFESVAGRNTVLSVRYIFSIGKKAKKKTEK